MSSLKSAAAAAAAAAYPPTKLQEFAEWNLFRSVESSAR